MVYEVNKMGYKWTLNDVAFSCSKVRVNHNELRIMFGFLVLSYSPHTCLSNCTVSHPRRANMSLQWEAQTSTTSRQFTISYQWDFGQDFKDLLSVI